MHDRQSCHGEGGVCADYHQSTFNSAGVRPLAGTLPLIDARRWVVTILQAL
jgi:hypothetical protein